MLRKLKNTLVGVLLVLLAISLDSHIFKENRMKNKGWWLVVFALLGVLIGLLGCAKYQPYTSVYPLSFPPQMNELAAVTECEAGGQPIILVNANVEMPRAMWKYVLIHERQHAVDMREYGCREAMKRVQTDPDFLMTLEVKAYCAQFVAMNSDGIFPEPAWQFRAMFEGVYDHYGRHLPKDVFFRRIPCRPSDPP